MSLLPKGQTLGAKEEFQVGTSARAYGVLTTPGFFVGQKVGKEPDPIPASACRPVGSVDQPPDGIALRREVHRAGDSGEVEQYVVKVCGCRSIDPKNVIQNVRRYFNRRASVLTEFDG
jgi:hypothetical protein